MQFGKQHLNTVYELSDNTPGSGARERESGNGGEGAPRTSWEEDAKVYTLLSFESSGVMFQENKYFILE